MPSASPSRSRRFPRSGQRRSSSGNTGYTGSGRLLVPRLRMIAPRLPPRAPALPGPPWPREVDELGDPGRAAGSGCRRGQALVVDDEVPALPPARRRPGSSGPAAAGRRRGKASQPVVDLPVETRHAGERALVVRGVNEVEDPLHAAADRRHQRHVPVQPRAREPPSVPLGRVQAGLVDGGPEVGVPQSCA